MRLRSSEVSTALFHLNAGGFVVPETLAAFSAARKFQCIAAAQASAALRFAQEDDTMP